jgi:hypothetical protein
MFAAAAVMALAAVTGLPFLPELACLIFASSSLPAWIRPFPASAAARLIDRHHNLKDRTITTLVLLKRKNRTLLEQLQIDDTGKYVPCMAQAVVSVEPPKKFWFAMVAFLTSVFTAPYIHNQLYHSAGNTEIVSQEVLSAESIAALEEIVAQVEELVQRHAGEQSLLKLSEKLEALLGKFDLKRMDAKESLMMLSEMEEAYQMALDSLSLETMEQSLQELAKTLELAEKTLPISKALEKGDYNQAAQEMKKMDAEALESLSEPERKAMAEEMQAMAENAEKRNQKQLQEAAQKMSDALENGDGDAGKSAAEELANEMDKHGVRQSIGKDLAQQKMDLAMMKADSGDGNMSGGKGTDKSEHASQTWGAGSAGNPTAGQETNLQGQRQQERLTGALSAEGESTKETIDSHEMVASEGQRQYREQYQQYQRLSEAVLDTEPIPMGQRQVIRRYFEAIRPVVE